MYTWTPQNERERMRPSVVPRISVKLIYLLGTSADSSTLNIVSSEIKHYFFKWFAVNLMKNHVDKCYLLVNASNKGNIRVNNINICNEKCKNLFGCKFLPQTYIWSPYFWIMQIYELQRGWALIWIYKRGVCLWTWFLLHQNLVVVLSNRCFAVVLTNGIQKSSLNVTWELLIRKSSYRLKSY